ncbi:GLL7 protein, partial [Alectura lathami]|nr:GLL7 protein [Alectura lathami]
MRVLYQLLAVLFVVLQSAVGQPYFPSTLDPCYRQRGTCVPGICRRPYYWIGTCRGGESCCAR